MMRPCPGAYMYIQHVIIVAYRCMLHVGFWPLNWVVDVDGPWIRWGAGATIPGGKEREGYALIGVKGGEALAEEQGGRARNQETEPELQNGPPKMEC